MWRSDRCANPMRGPGEKGHLGRNLRSISSKMREKFPFLPLSAKICDSCRKRAVTYVSRPSVPMMNLDDASRPCSDASPQISMPQAETHAPSPDVMSSSLRSGRSFHLDDSAVFLDDEEGNVSEEDNVSEDDNSDVDPSVSKRYRSSREIELEEMLDGLKSKFNELKNYSERLQILTVLPNSWSARKVALEFSITRHMASRAKKLRETKGVFASPTAKAGHSLPSQTVEKVQNFYLENSRVMPGMKDKVSFKVNGEKKIEQKHMVLENLQDLHRKYKNEYPEAMVGFSKFAELRPKQCILAGANGTHVVCVCTYHQNCKLMLEAIDIMTLTKDSSCPLKDYKDCLAQLMCTNPTPACHLDECVHCPGVKPLSRELKRLLSDSVVETVEFRVWQSTDRCTLATEKLPTDDFVDLLVDRLKTLKTHHFIAREQSAFVKDRKENLGDGEVLVHCDFSENYAFVAQDAAQSFHYNNDQCTVHPVVYYHRDGNEIHHRSLVVLSDSTIHDTAAVYLIQKILIQHVKDNCENVRKIIYVTDGAAQHYKNRYQMANLLHHKTDFGIEAEAHFHATAHGKGACDGVGAVLKREARRKSLQIVHGEPILTPDALFRWSKDNFKGIDVFFYTKEEHENIKIELRGRFDRAKAVPAIQKHHCFIPKTQEQLSMKRYSASEIEEVFPKRRQRATKEKARRKH